MRAFAFVALLLLCTAGLRAAEIRERDDTDHVVTLPSPAARIVSLAPNITELLYWIGAGDRIVGADEYSNYPEAAKAIPRVNNHASANFELILTLAPDVVIAWQSGNGELPARARALGLPVFVIEPQRLEDIPALFRRLGRLTGQDPLAASRAADFEQKLVALRESQRGKAQVSVFYQIWGEPLITLNDKHIVSDVISLCGGRNVFGTAAPLVPYVSIEAVLAQAPEVIVASGSAEGRPEWLDMWREWPAVPAVRDGLVFSIPPDLMQRHSARILEGAEQLCRFLDRAR